MKSFAFLTANFLTCATWATTSAVAENWNQFRGAAGGIAADADLPVQWAPDKHIVWKATLPGVGWSQPVAWGDRIFLTAAESDQQARPNQKNTGPGFSGLGGFLSASGLKPPQASYRWMVVCLDAASGNVIWKQVVREGRPTMQIHPNNTYATETPATDGERIYAYFGMTGVYCYDLAGKQLWMKDLGAYPMQFGWGTGSSPTLYGDNVYIQCDNDQSSFIVALNKKTGEEVWRQPRDEKSNWSTPYIWRNKLRTELVAAGGSQMRSYDPDTGAELWSLEGHGRTAITPVGDDELLFVDSANRLTGVTGAMTAIRPGASGKLSLHDKEASEGHIAWSAEFNGHRDASPLIYQDCLYCLAQPQGVLRCLDAKTGQEHYRKRLPGAAGFTASPIAGSGRVYCLSENGRTVVIAAGPELRVLATNNLDEMCWASPGVVGNHLLVRTVDHLYCISGE